MKAMLAFLCLFGLLDQAAAENQVPYDSVLIERVECMISSTVSGARLFDYGISESKRLILPFGGRLGLKDLQDNSWTAAVTAPFMPVWGGVDVVEETGKADYMAKTTSKGLVIRKQALKKSQLEVSFETDAFAKPLRGKDAEFFGDTYNFSATASADSSMLRMHVGSFSSQAKHYMNCEIIKREVNYNEL